jgi:hypothetical protein
MSPLGLSDAAIDEAVDALELAARAFAYVRALPDIDDDGSPAPVALSPYGADSSPSNGFAADLTAFCRTVAELRGQAELEEAA